MILVTRTPLSASIPTVEEVASKPTQSRFESEGADATNEYGLLPQFGRGSGLRNRTVRVRISGGPPDERARFESAHRTGLPC